MTTIGLVLEGDARHALVAALSRAGYEVEVASSEARLAALLQRNGIDAWIFDARSEGVLEMLLPTGCYLLPADNIPASSDRKGVTDWAASLLIQLDLALTISSSATPAGGLSRWKEVRAVWLIAGSAGATSAVQAFFDGFDEPPPVAFIYAQHLDPGQQHQLQSFTLSNKCFSLTLAEGAQVLEPGRIVMVSPQRKVVLNKFGHIAGIRSDWAAAHTPDINELLIILTAARLPSPGVIVFSGMGNDGAEALPVFDAGGGIIWAQSPETAIAPGMPQAAINTGLVQRTGDPQSLARALTNLYRGSF